MILWDPNEPIDIGKSVGVVSYGEVLRYTNVLPTGEIIESSQRTGPLLCVLRTIGAVETLQTLVRPEVDNWPEGGVTVEPGRANRACPLSSCILGEENINRGWTNPR